MSLYIASLNSGSNGNCYYVGNGQEAVLIDAGVSCIETEKRMLRLGLSMSKVKAIFISHEHIDHIKGVNVLAKRYQLPVYITPGTLQYSRFLLDNSLLKVFMAEEPFTIGGLSITAFQKHHDAADPHSFIVQGNNVTVGIFTDLGIVCDNLIRHFKQCHAAFLEANYDADMLENGRYPYHLKQRIRGGKGHLSNAQALELFIQHRPRIMSHLFLSHLSKENNDPELAANLFRQHAGGVEVVVASRYEETAVYQVAGNVLQERQPLYAARLTQATLF